MEYKIITYKHNLVFNGVCGGWLSLLLELMVSIVLCTYPRPKAYKPLAPLSAHLESQNVEFMQFAFRWMNCLLMREISVKNTIRMWDTYLVSPFVSLSLAGG